MIYITVYLQNLLLTIEYIEWTTSRGTGQRIRQLCTIRVSRTHSEYDVACFGC